jgi:predicted site-specific integrase-resolvase
MDKYVKSKIAVKELNIREETLRRWSKQGKIDFILTAGRQRLYNIEKYLIDIGAKEPVIETSEASLLLIRKKICYCRVSSKGQKDDLERQISLMISLYPEHELITDIGSGLNYKRKGLLQIIDYAINNELEELVIAYKDRLSRFSYDLLYYN